MKYELRRDSAMYRLWAALPLGQWVSAGEVRRLAPESVHSFTTAMAGLVARNLVQRRPSRSSLKAYDYLRLPESDAVETPDGPPERATVGGSDVVGAREAGGEEPFAHSVSGGAETPARPPMSATVSTPHGTARKYMTGCRCVECTRAYESTMKALGL